MKLSQLIATIICLSLILIIAGCTDSTDTPSETTPVTTQNTFTPSDQNLTIHFLDVGQGDSILIEYENKSMLIDAGESDQGEGVITYLQDQGISTLDYVVATHPHSDHVGGMDEVLKNFRIEHFVESGDPIHLKPMRIC